MGVTGLWPILSELSERKPLTYLEGKKVAVDLSGWVVQAIACKGLNTCKNPHLRNLFFRVSRLLQHGAHPIFVIEGKPPALKEAAFIKRQYVPGRRNFHGGDISRPIFDRILQNCQELLECLGVPCFKSSGEAEAMCALLCLKGVVDGVITEDNDAFLYGADAVFRDFSIDPMDPHINIYSLKSTKNKLEFDQSKLVALALLLGCDYVKGVPGIGRDAVLKLLEELKGIDLLQRFRDWKQLSENELFPGYESEPIKKGAHCNRCSHLGSSTKHKRDGCEMCDSKIACYLSDPAKSCSCQWHKNNEICLNRKTELRIYNTVKKIPDFPSTEVIDEYLSYTDKIPDEESLEWKCPNLKAFQEKALNCFFWTIEHSQEKCLPIITSWQQYKLSMCCQKEEEIFLYEPVQILKERTVKGEDCFEVQWKLPGSNNESDENLVTVEFAERFANSYPRIVQTFHAIQQKAKDEKKTKHSKAEARESKLPCKNRKMTDYFEDHQAMNNDVAQSIDCGSESVEQVLDLDEPSPKKLCLSE